MTTADAHIEDAVRGRRSWPAAIEGQPEEPLPPPPSGDAPPLPPPGPVDRGFDTTNDFGFGINGHGIITPALPLRPMDRMTALRAAAYIVLVADPQGDLFAAVLERVKHP